MQIVTIIADKNGESLNSIINEKLNLLKNEDIYIKDELNNNSLKYMINCKTNNNSISEFINTFKCQVSHGIYEYIKTYEEPNIIKDIISLEYNYFNIDERKEILQRSLGSAGKINSTKEEILGQKAIIIDELVKYFETNNEINIKGFITFRLKNYVDDMKLIIDEAVEDFLMDKEYTEFIKLLKYFVDIQDSKVDLVHIYMKDENEYSIFDDSGKEINDEYLRLIAAEMKENDLSYDDLLISSLITIAPNSIIIHKTGNNSFEYITGTINRIFNNKVELCDNCDWCTIRANAKED